MPIDRPLFMVKRTTLRFNTFMTFCVPWMVACAGVLLTRFHLVQAEVRSEAGWVAVIAVVWGVGVHFGRLPRLSWRVILGALLLRLALVGTPPLLSDDLYRYLWEGLALNMGENPYLAAPETFEPTHSSSVGKVNHPELTSIYPPLAMLWFRFLAWAGGSPAWVQCCTVLVDLANVLLLAKLGTQLSRDSRGATLYALHPIPILACAVGGHIDTLALMMALCACASMRGVGASAWATAGALTKLLPAVLMLFCLRRHGWRASIGGAFPVLLFVLAASGSVLWEAGLASLDSLAMFTQHWSFNGLLYPWLAMLTPAYARTLLTGLWLCGVTAFALRSSQPLTVLAAMGVGLLLCSPTVHPWYLLWAFGPLCVLMGRAATLPLSFLLGSYAVLFSLHAGGAWAEPIWLWGATWTPALLTAAYFARAAPPAIDTHPYPQAYNIKKGKLHQSLSATAKPQATDK